MKRTIYTLIATALLLSCSGHEVRNSIKVLDDVESYIQERPDSALFVLEGIDRLNLNTRGLKARHGLLLSMALDKNFIDLTSDSLIAPVVEYYEGKTRLGIQPPILNTFSFTRKLSRGTYSVKSGRVLQFPFSIALTPKLTSYENNDHTVSEAPFRSGC